MKNCLTLLLLVCPIFDALADNYVVRPNGDDHLSATVELTLNQALESVTAFGSRSVGGVAPTITDTRCTFPTGLADIEREGLYWKVPKGCSQLSWSIGFHTVGDRSYELSKQESFYHPKGWWFLNESGSLLRYADQKVAMVCALFSESETCTDLPPLTRAPMFLVFGKMERTFDWKAKPIEVYAGFDAKHLGLEHLVSSFRVALEKIDEMTVSVRLQDEVPSPLQFVWLSIDAEKGTVGGAAGHRAFLSNYRIDGDTVAKIEKTRLLIISGHEYMHMIGVDAGSHWATETLATYYGFKAVASLDHALEAFEQMAGVDHPEAPLVVRGAALWRELDEAISQSTKGRDSLDDLLALLTETFESENRLPAEFLNVVAKKIGQPRLETLLSTYF